jgi:hypothetical protein
LGRVRRGGQPGAFVIYLIRAIWRSVVTTLFLLGLILSPNVYLAARVLFHASEGVLIDYRLRQIPPERYDAEIRTALDKGDGDLARSLVALASDRDVAVAPELTKRIAALPAVDVGNILRQGWSCIANGDFDSEAGFACVVATDLTGIGDVRDLVGEGSNYLQGKPVNYFTLGIASVGLTLTAATLASIGSVLPIRAGASFVKGMNKVGKLPPRLVGEIGVALSKSVDKAALAEAVNLAREFKLGELQRPLSRLFRPKSLTVVSDLATDFGTIGKVGGVRAMKLSAETAGDVKDVKILARAAERYQGRFLGVMRLVGHGALRLADLMLTLSGWMIGAVLWLLGFAVFLTRTTAKTARFAGKLLFRPRRMIVRVPAMAG